MKSRESGSALITVILVVFVLTMVGIASLLYMSVEDRLSSNDQQQKAALYAAESGLRRGELAINDQATANPSILSTMISYTSGTTPALTLPDNGYSATILRTAYGGGGVELADVALPHNVGGTLTYSLYVRNNKEDSSGSATVDGDKRINIVSVGILRDQTGRTFRKILEEQLFAGGAGGINGGNPDLDAGGTGSAGIGGH